MRLLRFTMTERRGEPARNLDLGRDAGGAPLVAITGPAGVGKTSVIEAIALHKEHLAPYGKLPSSAELVGREPGPLEIESEWLLDEAEQAVTGSQHPRLVGRSRFADGKGTSQADPALVHVLSRYSHRPDTALVDLIPARRLHARGIAPGSPVLWQRQNRLATTADKYIALPKMLVDAPEDLRQHVAALTAAICPHLRLHHDRPGPPRFSTRHGDRSLAELSTAQRLAFDVAATFVLLGLQRSVVLYDTPELALGPDGAVRTIGALRDYAPNTQLIVATQDRGLLALPETLTIHLEAS